MAPQRLFFCTGMLHLLVQTNKLTKAYGDFLALDDCTMSVDQGEIFGLLGPNGAGKTTLLRLMMGFLRPTSGSATIEGLDCYRQRVDVHRRVAYLPGDARMFRQMRGRKALKFFADVRERGNFQKSLEFADRLELDLSRRVSFMSTGMRQKLALASALATDTGLLILDEPTANLDPTVRHTVIEMVVEARNEGRTVVFSSHVLSEVEDACDRVVILREGQLVHTQVMSELRRQHLIRAELNSPMPPVPTDLDDHLSVTIGDHGEVKIETAHELSGLLGWLGTLPLREVRIEPVGLRSIYQRFHARESVAEDRPLSLSTASVAATEETAT
jgi:ABC-2 type transport system ATP-binding protein